MPKGKIINTSLNEDPVDHKYPNTSKSNGFINLYKCIKAKARWKMPLNKAEMKRIELSEIESRFKPIRIE